MAYLERARSFLERGDRLRAAITLIEGLRKDPGNDEALDELIAIYVRDLTSPGLERDLVDVLQLRGDAGTRLTLIEHALEGEDGAAKLAALSSLFIKTPRPRDSARRSSVERRAEHLAPAIDDDEASVSSIEPEVHAEQTLPMPSVDAQSAEPDRDDPLEEPSFLSDESDLEVDLAGDATAWDEPTSGVSAEQWKPMAVGFAAVALLLLVFFVVWSASGPALDEPPAAAPAEGTTEGEEAGEP